MYGCMYLTTEVVMSACLTRIERTLHPQPTDGNEGEVGDAFTDAFAAGLKREDVFITSKLWNSEHNPQHVLPACEQCVANDPNSV